MLTKIALRFEPAGKELGDFDVATDDLFGLCRVGLDKRRIAFRIARPAKLPTTERRRQIERTAQPLQDQDHYAAEPLAPPPALLPMDETRRRRVFRHQ